MLPPCHFPAAVRLLVTLGVSWPVAIQLLFLLLRVSVFTCRFLVRVPVVLDEEHPLLQYD